MKERIDELDTHYVSIGKVDRWARYAFYGSALISLCIPYSNIINATWFGQAINTGFIVFVMVYFLLSHFNGLYLIPRVEGVRRKQLLSDSLGMPLTPEKTQLYYNNGIGPSVLKLGANVMENAFVSKNVCEKMAVHERKMILLYAIIWLVAIFNRSTDLTLLLALTQFLLSGEIITRWIKVEILRARNSSIYERLYDLYLNRKDDDAGLTASIIDAFSAYESAKASAAIKQSSEMFFSINPRLTEEWEVIKERLKLQGC